MELKIECECGQHYSFDVEPVHNRMPFPVHCPACRAEGTQRANALLASRADFAASPVSQAILLEASPARARHSQSPSAEVLDPGDVSEPAAGGPAVYAEPPGGSRTMASPQRAAGGVAFSHSCRFHPKTPARFSCPNCQEFFCEACVASRISGGTPRPFCRHCGAECTRIQVQFQVVAERTFLQYLPDAFAYPTRGGGLFIVLGGIIVVGMLKGGQVLMSYGTIRTVLMGLLLEIAAGGYLFTYCQSILHATSAEERELPDLPGIGNFLEDMLVPFLRLAAVGLFCFGPAIALAIWVASTRQFSLAWVPEAALVAGYLYFPMALLAVAIVDSVLAANPLLVFPSILRAPLEYLITLTLLASTYGFEWLSAYCFERVFPEGWTTHSVAVLVGMLAWAAIASFTNLYLLIVGVRALGLLYVVKKDQLGWLRA